MDCEGGGADDTEQEMLDWLLEPVDEPAPGGTARGEAALAVELALPDAWLSRASSESVDTPSAVPEGGAVEASQHSGGSASVEVRDGSRGTTPPAASDSPEVGAEQQPISGASANASASVKPPQLRLLRCLDPSHPQPCVRCIPAPPWMKEMDFELVGACLCALW